MTTAVISDPAAILRQRKEVLEEVKKIARLCGWPDLQGLEEQVWQDLVDIDNATLSHLQETGDEQEAADIWNEGMESMRHWLSLVLGIRITFV